MKRNCTIFRLMTFVAFILGINLTIFAQNTWHPVGAAFTTGIPDVSHVASANEIYVAGSFGANTLPTTNGKVMKWNGTAWAALGTFGTVRSFSAMRYVAANSIYVAGTENSGAVNQVMRWSGTAWAAVGALNANSQIMAIEYGATNEVYAAGNFTNAGSSKYIAKWNGTAWAQLGVGFTTPINGLKYISATEIYALGTTDVGSWGCLRKWNGTAWVIVGSAFINDTNADGTAYAMHYVSANEIYVAGTIFDFVAGVTNLRVLKWNGTIWSVVGTDPIPQTKDIGVYIKSIAYKSASEIYVTGDLDYPAPGSTTDPENIFKWDGTTWARVSAPSPFVNAMQTLKYSAANDVFYATGQTDLFDLENKSAMYKYEPCIPAAAPTLTANHTNVCGAQTVTLTATGVLNDATTWTWYSGSCGGAGNPAIGTGASITVNPTSTTVYYARGEGFCATLGACGNVSVTARADQHIYVKANATGLNNGTSWTNAYTSLQAALDQTTVCDTIFVAQGTYKPSKDVAGTATAGRTGTFKIPSGIKVFGGFIGTETQLAQRPHAVSVTGSGSVLSGEIATAALTDNVYHVVSFVNASADTELDGFVIEKGYANGAAASNYNKGGGIYNNGSGASGYSAPVIRRCLVRNNFCATTGGGMFDNGITGGEVYATIRQCIFTANSAVSGAGYYGLGKAATNGFCSTRITNSLFCNNTATGDGGGVYFYNDINTSGAISNLTGPSVTLCTFTGNTVGAAKKGRGVYLLEGLAYVNESISYHGVAQSELEMAAAAPTYSTLYLSNNITLADPLFVNAAANDFRLTACSPAINASTLVPSSFESPDLDGNARPLAGTYKDLGCYERQTPIASGRRYVRAGATGGLNNGTSWANAYTSLQTALENACNDTIWVGPGTYYPTKDLTGNASPTDPRTKTFRVPSGTVLLGGFLGTETLVSQRIRPIIYAFNSNAILSGSNGVGISNNFYHVVTLINANQNTVLDGFRIEKGNANGAAASDYDKGGGVFSFTNENSFSHKPAINNCVFANNSATNGGGIASKTTGGYDATFLKNCIFHQNTATNGGGASIEQSGASSSGTYLAGCLFAENTASNGGGLYLSGGVSTSSVHNTFAANTAYSTGNAIYLEGSVSSNTSALLWQCIVWGANSATAPPIAGNKGYYSGSNNIIQNYSAIPTAFALSNTNNYMSGTTIIATNPAFKDPPNYDYTLWACSPAINAGSTTSFLTTDLNDRPRVYGGNVDYGAYELQNTTPVSPSIAIAASQTNVCANVKVTFTATITDGGYTPTIYNAGLTPTFDWRKNGTTVASNIQTYTALVNPNDVITCVLTSAIPCANTPITSNAITITRPILTAILYVDSTAATNGTGASWATAMPSLAEAVILSYQCGGVDTIKIAKGTYLPAYQPITNTNTTLAPFPITDLQPITAGPLPQTVEQIYEYMKTFQLRSGLHLQGGYANGGSTRNISAYPTVLSGNLGNAAVDTDNAYHVVTAMQNTTLSSLDGLTIRGGNGRSYYTYYLNGHEWSSSNGAGLIASYQSKIKVNNCIFTQNKNNQYGGAIFVDSSTLTITNTVFNQNTGIYGGAISSRNANNTISNSQFTNNTSVNGRAGALYNTDTQTRLYTCDFTNNTTSNSGGAIHNSGRQISIENCIFMGNTAKYGGAIMSEYDTCLVRNTLFLNNAATATTGTTGGGACYHSGPNTASTNLTLQHCTIYNNTSAAGIAKGGIANNSGFTNITNCIIRNNTTNIYNAAGATLNANYANIEGGYAGTANIDSDPLFINAVLPKGADGLWRTPDDGFALMPCSPSVDAGTNSTLPIISANDIAANPRIYNNGTTDVGAYEYQGENCNTIYTGGAACNTITLPNVQGNAWFNIVSATGIIASINPNGMNLGNLVIKISDLSSVPTHPIQNSIKFIPRIMDIQCSAYPTGVLPSAYSLKLYYYDAEFDAYKIAINNSSISLQDLNIAWATGGSGCSVTNYNSTNNGLIDKAMVAEVDYGVGGNGFYLAFDLNHFTLFAPTISIGTPLPVKLLTFIGKTVKNANQLNWATATEQNASHFEIEASVTGLNFKNIGRITANNRQNGGTYTFTDNEPTSIAYYRLKMIDNDGSFEYSNVILLQQKPNAVNVQSVYPNPTDHDFMIAFTTEIPTDINFTLYDAFGKKLITLIKTSHTGFNEQNINTTDLPSGVYHLRISTSDGKAQTHKIIKL